MVQLKPCYHRLSCSLAPPLPTSNLHLAPAMLRWTAIFHMLPLLLLLSGCCDSASAVAKAELAATVHEGGPFLVPLALAAATAAGSGFRGLKQRDTVQARTALSAFARPPSFITCTSSALSFGRCRQGGRSSIAAYLHPNKTRNSQGPQGPQTLTT